MGNPLLKVENVDVFYGVAQALWDVSFSAEEHKITALLGANGAGKSTLLKTISGVVQPTKGRIVYAGSPLVDCRPEMAASSGISHVPEGRRLFSSLTVLENLELGAYLPSVRPMTKESLQRVFALFPVLKSRMRQLAGTLSGGEQQMLAIGRALMARPTLLLLDEPSLGLAPIVVKLLFDIIKKLNRDGVTILLVEQNVRKTLEIADYAFVLKTGVMR
ncbi:MAG TPA: ABC transporter ATP-binding protein, partial [Syntrophorhabdales bacterium]|nr:ABC transporter ATP-binding protein [Syntrophorhabdales bacterium]